MDHRTMFSSKNISEVISLFLVPRNFQKDNFFFRFFLKNLVCPKCILRVRRNMLRGQNDFENFVGDAVRIGKSPEKKVYTLKVFLLVIYILTEKQEAQHRCDSFRRQGVIIGSKMKMLNTDFCVSRGKI